MSFGERQSRLFFEPLKGKTTAFRLGGRPSNLRFASAILGLLAGARLGCRFLDLDAFYSSNLEVLAVGVPREGLDGFDITIPEPGSETEAALAALLLGGGDKPLLIDSANSLYQLLSARNPRAASRKFTFFVSALSNWAESNGEPVIATIYERRPAAHRRAPRSLADVFDNSVSLSAKRDGLAFRCERGSAWRGGGFFLPFDDGYFETHDHGERYQE
jgi:hypothetical protein